MSFSPMPRTATRPEAPSPGPGSYSPIRKNIYPELTLRSRTKNPFKQLGPGPADYNISSKWEGPQITSPFRPRTYRGSTTKQGNPGPNAYNVPPPVHGAPEITLHSRIKQQPADVYISPQRYRPDFYYESVEKQQGFSMRPRTGGTFAAKEAKNAPGPGSYSPDFKKSAKSSTRDVCINRPRTGRIGAVRDFGPGPGSYNIDKKVKEKEYAGAQLGARWNKAVCTF